MERYSERQPVSLTTARAVTAGGRFFNLSRYVKVAKPRTSFKVVKCQAIKLNISRTAPPRRIIRLIRSRGSTLIPPLPITSHPRDARAFCESCAASHPMVLSLDGSSSRDYYLWASIRRHRAARPSILERYTRAIGKELNARARNTSSALFSFFTLYRAPPRYIARRPQIYTQRLHHTHTCNCAGGAAPRAGRAACKTRMI